MKVLNNNICTTKLPPRATKVSSGFAVMTSSVGNVKQMLELLVVIGNDKIPQNSKVWVSSDSYNQPWAANIYILGEREFIIIPETSVLLVETQNDGSTSK